jgi:hypothetical protein
MRKGFPRGHQRKSAQVAYRLAFNQTLEDRQLMDYLEPLRKDGKVTATIKAALHAYIEGEQKYDVLVTQVNRLMELVQNGDIAIGHPVNTGPMHIQGSDIELPPPSYEDDDVIVIKRNKNADEEASFNFLNCFEAIANIGESSSNQTRTEDTSGE